MRVNYSGIKFDEKEFYKSIQCITKNWWILAQKGKQFQSEFCKVIGRKYGVFVNSGSSANFLAIYYAKKMGIKKVITPVSGFPTTITPILQLGLQSIFIDIELDTLNLDLDKFQQVAKNNPNEGVCFAHVLGNPPNMNKVMQIVKRYNLYFIQDTCDALGSQYLFTIKSLTKEEQNALVQKEIQKNMKKGYQGIYRFEYTKQKKLSKKLGTFGEISTYSFFPAHHMSTGQGGFVATDDYQTYLTIRSLRDWGRSCFCYGKQDSNKKNGRCENRFGSHLYGHPEIVWDHRYCFKQMGFNLKPLELQAVLGLEQIKKLEQFANIRKYNYEKLNKVFCQYEDLFIIPKATQGAMVNWFAYPVTIKTDKFKREQLLNYLQDNDIQTRLYFAGNMLYQQALQDYVKQKYDCDYKKIDEQFPNALQVTKNTFFLGVSQVIDEQQIQYICLKIKEFMNRL